MSSISNESGTTALDINTTTTTTTTSSSSSSSCSAHASGSSSSSSVLQDCGQPNAVLGSWK